MIMQASFNAPLPVTQTSSDSPTVQLSANIKGNTVTITEVDLIGRNARQKTYTVTAADETTFTVPDDLDQSTINMLIGVSQRIRDLQRNGFPAET